MISSEQLLKGEKKFLQKVGGYGCAVFGSAANVIDGADFSEDGGTSAGDDCCSDGFANKNLLGRRKAGGVFAEAAGADTYVRDLAVIHQGQSGDGYLGDGLSVAGANLPDIGFVTFKLREMVML